jgi:WXXGXW repeat (2 copies)
MNRFARLRLTAIATAMSLGLGQSAYAQNKIVVPKPPPETGATQGANDPESAFNPRTGDNLTWDQDKLSWINAKTGENVGFQGRIADVKTGQEAGPGTPPNDRIVVPKPPPETGATQGATDPESAFNPRTGDNLTWDQDKLSWINAKTGENVGFQGRIADVKTGENVGFQGRVVDARTEEEVTQTPGSIRIGPPPLPVYEQPLCPTPGYMWTPGYWGYGPGSYFWVPGTWVPAPSPGLLWTPGYWGFAGGLYGWHPGYWGPNVGFYGGVNYGFGYGGVGFGGGVWEGGVFRYNTAAVRVDTSVIHNTYVDRTVIHETTVNRASFNGEGGTTARPTAAEVAAAREPHTAPTSEQTSHEHLASTSRSLLASENQGHPAVAATAKAGEFNGQGVVAAHGSGGGAGKTETESFTPPKSETHTEAGTQASKENTKTPKAKKETKPPKPPKVQGESKPREEKHPK